MGLKFGSDMAKVYENTTQKLCTSMCATEEGLLKHIGERNREERYTKVWMLFLIVETRWKKKENRNKIRETLT